MRGFRHFQAQASAQSVRERERGLTHRKSSRFNDQTTVRLNERKVSSFNKKNKRNDYCSLGASPKSN
uniref:Uncharacterized protein n=1 Tax=Nelumbo nucifera TaxID=4432 RepID=A0A822ZAQ0_NELNU|nr:TPA_asm: hypothetical protein HUJ06_012920 [Nelumbo nucifera]